MLMLTSECEVSNKIMLVSQRSDSDFYKGNMKFEFHNFGKEMCGVQTVFNK